MRLMRKLGLVAKRRCCFKRTTHRNPAHPAAPNLLEQCFETTAVFDNLKPLWIKSGWPISPTVPTWEGWLCLAAVMDLHSRRILDWCMDARMTEPLVHQAMCMALDAHHIDTDQLIHHSDRGSQYTSADYQTLLATHEIQVSMSGRGDCYDNARMESFFSILKTKLVHHDAFPHKRLPRTPSSNT